MTHRLHIGIFGRRNVGKSAVINALTGQQVAIVSDTPGTTTDPVKKAMELPDIGAVVLIDTAGIDDTGHLGALRTEQSKRIIAQVDVAVLVITANTVGAFERSLMQSFAEAGIPFVALHNKSDQQTLTPELAGELQKEYRAPVLEYTAIHPNNNEQVLAALKSIIPEAALHGTSLLGGLVAQNDPVLLITPMDSEAPEGRLILPQVQTIRDILDNHGVAIVLKESEVGTFLNTAKIQPKLAITDSQLFGKIDKIIPKDIPLTGFSILLARHKGDFEHYLQGTPAIDKLRDGDRILILESCTHHSTCDDIGRVKLPALLQKHTGRRLSFDVVSGLSPLPGDIGSYALVIQCGGCMITPRQLKNRLKPFVDAGIPVTNYGMAIASLQGIYEGAIKSIGYKTQ